MDESDPSGSDKKAYVMLSKDMIANVIGVPLLALREARDPSLLDSSGREPHHSPLLAPTGHTDSKLMDFTKLQLSYDGTTCIKEFLIRLEELKQVKGFSDDQCFRVFPVLLSGLALKWYRGKKSSIFSWAQLKLELEGQFLSEDYEYVVEHNLQTRKQT